MKFQKHSSNNTLQFRKESAVT